MRWAIAVLAGIGMLPACREPENRIPDMPESWSRDVVEEAEVADVPDVQFVRSAAEHPGKPRPRPVLRLSGEGTLDVAALEAQVGIPFWAAEGGDLQAVRDGDVLTAWSCTPMPAVPCALGFSFAEEVEARVVRLFPGLGTASGFRDAAKPSTVKIHTDAGWFESTLRKGRGFRYVLLPHGVRTGKLVVEFVENLPGQGDELSVAEIDVLGVGPARGAIRLEPRLVLTRLEGRLWREKDGEWRTAGGWVEMGDGEGAAVRFLEGTSLVGRPGSRFYLVTDVESLTCGPEGVRAEVRHTLLDVERRVWQWVPVMDDHIAARLQKPVGEGFAALDGRGQAAGVVLAGESHRTFEESVEDIGPWGFTALDDACCSSGRPASVHEACEAMEPGDARKVLSGPDDEAWKRFWSHHDQATPGSWWSCAAGGFRLVVFEADPCSEAPSLVAVTSGKGPGILDYRLGAEVVVGVPMEGVPVLQVTSEEELSADVLRITASGRLVVIYDGAALRIGLPRACRCVLGKMEGGGLAPAPDAPYDDDAGGP